MNTKGSIYHGGGAFKGGNDPSIGTVTGAANVGTGIGKVWRDFVAGILNFKSIKQGANITVTNNADDITLDCPAPGESNTASNVGTGTGQVFKAKVGVDLQLKTVKQGTNITVTNNASDITLDCPAPGESNTASNVGTGTGQVFKAKVGVDLQLKTVKQGTNITVTNNASDITLDCPAPGESNTASNVGAGTGQVFKQKTGVNLELKTLLQGSGVTITNNASDITIAASGGAPSWNPITFVAAETNTINGNTTLTITKPVGTIDGDLMLAFICTIGNTNHYVSGPPAGWTRLTCGPVNTEFNTLEVWGKYAASEGANYTFVISGVDDIRGIIVSYRNCMVSNKFCISNSGIADFNFALNITPPACTVAYPNSVSVVATCNEGNGSWTSVPAGYNSRGSVNNLRVSDLTIANTGISTPGSATVNDNKQRSAVNIILVRKYAYLDAMPCRFFVSADQMGFDTAGMALAYQTINFRTLYCWTMRQSSSDKLTAHLPMPFDWDGNYLGIRLLWTSQNATNYNLVKFQVLAFQCGQNESIGEALGTYYNNASDYGPTTVQVLRKTPEIWVPVQAASTVISPGGERSYFLSIARQPDGYAQSIYLIGAYITYIRKMQNSLSPTPFNT